MQKSKPIARNDIAISEEIHPMSLNVLTDLLGEPYFQVPGCLIYNTDSLEAMRTLPDECINLAVTSPPYNIGKEYEKQLSLAAYLDWCERWVTEIHRITTPNGAFWLNLGYLSKPNRAKAIPIP